MSQVKNILFIMCDQLRADYLRCTGHPTIKTPHIDALANDGAVFTHAFCQAPVADVFLYGALCAVPRGNL